MSGLQRRYCVLLLPSRRMVAERLSAREAAAYLRGYNEAAPGGEAVIAEERGAGESDGAPAMAAVRSLRAERSAQRAPSLPSARPAPSRVTRRRRRGSAARRAA